MENNYQLSRIHNYIHGLMSREEMHALEREALEDPFLQDAIDGYRLQNGVDSKSLSLLQQRLSRRVEEHAQRQNRYFFGWQRLAIGMVAAVMFVSVCILILIRYLPHKKQVNVTEVELMDETLQKVSVQAIGNTAAEPIGGWKTLAELLSKHYSGVTDLFELTLRFQIDEQGRPFNITSDVDDHLILMNELMDVLEKKSRWKGTDAEIKIVFN
ncbi:hypothetical protein [Sphingobacterium wenxiniae]|uniref:Uncharacterized protein n=1 Tax=Sphingobacterium wenxiniae TaxID=683125 RepID=A0A1I6R9V0_9SPHI|nr:hypothetical protein [Sphingobacterium wenxiniae]SFS61493.1 hypothetical protein SAMN05660206_103247 [Sphingobacterium wenxiniae]